MATDGMVLIGTQSFSAVSSASFDNVFSATYSTYYVRGNLTAVSAPGNNLDIVLRSAGTDATGTDYYRQLGILNDTSLTATRNSSMANFRVMAGYTNIPHMAETWIFNPFEVMETGGLTFATYAPLGSTQGAFVSYIHDSATSYDGFSVVPAVGTMTGSFSVWGLTQ